METSVPLKILVIDDEQMVLEMISQILSRSGFSVDTASNGKEGLRKIESAAYDLVLTDIKMPEISGLDILDRAKRIKGKGFPVIGMSGTPWLMEGACFDGVLEKPFPKTRLLQLIDTLFLV